MDNKVWNLIDTQTMVNGANWEDGKSTIRSSVFGKMVALSLDRVKHYQSDLYHDALWIDKNLDGSMQFDWIARECGTWIGDVVRELREEKNDRRYRFEIIGKDRKWTLNVYEAGLIVPIEPVHLCDECGALVGAHYVADMAMWLCSSHCTAKAQERLNNIAWTDRHAALDISDCEVAKSIEGCIFHPAPVGGWTMEESDPGCDLCGMHDRSEPCSLNSDGTFTETDQGNWLKVNYGNDEPDKQTLADAEDALKALDPINEIIGSLFDRPQFPTLRNKPTSSNIKEKVTMDSILRDLREKAQDAETAKDDLENAKYELDSAIEELEEYISSVNDLIDNLDNLPEVSVSVEFDVNFDS